MTELMTLGLRKLLQGKFGTGQENKKTTQTLQTAIEAVIFHFSSHSLGQRQTGTSTCLLSSISHFPNTVPKCHIILTGDCANKMKLCVILKTMMMLFKCKDQLQK